MSNVKLSPAFLDDHAARDLPTPAIVRETKNHYFIAADDPNLPELLGDARHYASGQVDMAEPHLVRSARSAVKAIERDAPHLARA